MDTAEDMPSKAPPRLFKVGDRVVAIDGDGQVKKVDMVWSQMGENLYWLDRNTNNMLILNEASLRRVESGDIPAVMADPL